MAPTSSLIEKLNAVVLILFGFALPLSIAATNLLLPLIVLLALWQHKALAAVFKAWRSFYWVGLALLLWVVISAAAFAPVLEQLPKTALIGFNHYRELLLILLVAALMAATSRAKLALQAFVIGALVLACIQFASLLNAKLAMALEAKRITNGFLLACAAYCAAWLAHSHHRSVNTENKRWVYAWAFAAALLASSCLLAVSGRTGYVVLAVLCALFVWQFGSKKWRIVLLAVVACAALSLAYLSPSFQKRWKEQTSELASYESQQNIATSTGLRIEFARNSLSMIKDHGLLGLGHGNFESQYKQFARNKYLSDPRFKPLADLEYMYPAHPHNEFLYQWLSGGLIGLILFSVWVFWPAAYALRQRSASAKGMAAMALAMATGCLFNALLLNLPEAHAYVFVLAAFMQMPSIEN